MCLQFPPAASSSANSRLDRAWALLSLTLVTPSLGTEVVSALVDYYAASLYSA